MTDADTILAELRELVVDQVPELSPGARLRSVAVRRRERSTLHVYALGEGPDAPRVIVKVPQRARADAERMRPRLFREIDTAEKPAREFEALRLVEREIGGAGDPRFRAVRPLGLILDGRALVMLEDRGTALSRVLLRYGRWSRRSRAPSAEQAFASAGAWLRRYHDLAVGETPTQDVTTRDGFLGHTGRLADHLVRQGGRSGEVARLAPQLHDRVMDVLPAALPIGLHHGDFAMRNVLVERDGSVAVIDMLAVLRAPIYKDLATMLVALHTNRAQTYTLGLAFDPRQLARFELALLDGYGASLEITEGARLFAATYLLDKWAAHLEAARRTRPAALVEGFLVDRHYGRLARGLLTPAPPPEGAAAEPGL